MNIHEFLALPHRFRWGGMGGDDCMTFPATWAMESIGVDPAERWRGTYRTREDAEKIKDKLGGAVGALGGAFMAIGAVPTDNPQDGDVGVVVMLSGETIADSKMTRVGAVRFGPLWAAISPAGVIAKKAECVAAWRLPT